MIPHVRHRPTIAERRNKSSVKQCAGCGALICTEARANLGPCPACGGEQWWRQELPVGPFVSDPGLHDVDDSVPFEQLVLGDAS